MNLIDAFFVNYDYFLDKFSQDFGEPFSEHKRIPLEEILKSDESYKKKVKQKQSVCSEDLTAKEDNDDTKKNSVLSKKTTVKQKNDINDKVPNTRKKFINSENLDKKSNEDLTQEILNGPNTSVLLHKLEDTGKYTNVEENVRATKFLESKKQTFKPSPKRILEVNNASITTEQKKGICSKTSTKSDEKIKNLSFHNSQESKNIDPPKVLLNEMNSALVLRRSSRIRERSQNLKFDASEFECESCNNKMANIKILKKERKHIPRDVAINRDTYKLSKKKKILDDTNCKHNSRELVIVCGSLDKSDLSDLKSNALSETFNEKLNSKSTTINSSDVNKITTRSNTKNANTTKTVILNVKEDSKSTKKINKIKVLHKKDIKSSQKKENVKKELTNANKFKTQKKTATKRTTFKFLKERQEAFKENLNNKDTVEEFPLVKKNKALEKLMKASVDETLTLKTPKLKKLPNTTNTNGITPRSGLINELGKEFSSKCLALTPQNASKSKSDKDSALHVLYKHLDKNSRKRKTTANPLNTKTVKISKEQTNFFKDLKGGEKEWLNSLSQNPYEDKSEASFDDYFNQSV